MSVDDTYDEQVRQPRGPGAMWNPSPCSANGFRCGSDAEFGQEFCAEHMSRVPLEMLDAINDTGIWPQSGDCE